MLLEPVATNIWLCEGPLVDFHSFPYPTRMVIIRLPDGALWVWSPIALTPDIKDEVDVLGPVAHLVSPNKIHHLFLGEWSEAYPEARLWGLASVIKKRRDLEFQPALKDAPPDVWQGAIDQAWFHGSPAMDEIVFFHRASATAILADLSEHFSEDFLKSHWKGWQRPIARMWGIVEGRGYAPLEWRLSWWRRKSAKIAARKLLGWQPRQVIMAHGTWLRDGGVAFIETAFNWLLK